MKRSALNRTLIPYPFLPEIQGSSQKNGQEDRKSQGLRRTALKKCFVVITRISYTGTHSGYDSMHKNCQPKLQGRCSLSLNPLLKSYWQLIAAGERESIVFGCGP